MKTPERHAANKHRQLSWRKRALFSCITLALVLLALFLIAETGLRLFFPQTMNVYAYDPDYLFAFRSHATINYTSSEFSQVTKFNSQGFKDNEYDYLHKQADGYRVLVLGDSFAVGLEVGLNETFVKRIEQDLRRWQRNPNIEVLSVATNGWSTEQELLFLEKKGLSYKPDLVVLAFYVGNDPIDNIERNLLLYDGKSLTPNPDRPLAQSRLRAAYYFLSSHFHTFNFAMYEWWKIRDSLGKSGGINYDAAFLPYVQADEPPSVTIAWQKTLALLDRVHADLKERNIPLVLLIIPDRIQESKEFRMKHAVPGTGILLDKPQFILRTFANRNNITAIDLLPTFQEHAVDNLHFAQDFHWNAAGHARTAKTAAPVINNFINWQKVAHGNGE